jgi:hypothetical protein
VVRTTAKCGSTYYYQGKLYSCTSQGVGINGEATGCGQPGTYCSPIAPDHVSYEATAWQYVQDC